MNGRKHASRRSLKSDLARVDAHSVKPEEYDELPELTEEMLARAKINKGGQVTLYVSSGKPQVTVPDVRGISSTDAVSQLSNIHLKAKIVQVNSARVDNNAAAKAMGDAITIICPQSTKTAI